MTAAPCFNPLTGSLSFHVSVHGRDVLAYLSDAAWRAFYGDAAGDDLSDCYRRHQPTIDRAVARRFVATGREPVVLRVTDLQ